MPIHQCNNLIETSFMNTMAFTVKIKTNDFQRKSITAESVKNVENWNRQKVQTYFSKSRQFFFINDTKLLSDENGTQSHSLKNK